MRNISRRYAIFIVILAIAISIKLNNYGDKYVRVEPFRGAKIQQEVFYPIMSKNLNESKLLRVSVNGERKDMTYPSILFSTRLIPMIETSKAMEIFGLSALMLDDEHILVQNEEQKILLTVGQGTYTSYSDYLKLQEIKDAVAADATRSPSLIPGISVSVNDREGVDSEDFDITIWNLKTAPILMSGRVYLPIEDLCILQGYGYSYNANFYNVDVSYEKEAALPQKYDLRDLNKVGSIRNQGNGNTCWAYSSIAALESSLRPRIDTDLSVAAMAENPAFNMENAKGGDFAMALAYLLSWQGPVQEGTRDGTVAHLQEAQFYDSDEMEEIKKAVFKYGGVTTSVYVNISSSNLNDNSFYNPVDNSYCYVGANESNHDVVIIGWDDTFAKEKFSIDVPSDGAFICQNSWGSHFGDAGVFYVSYFDTNIGHQAVCYSSVDTRLNYNNIYQTDLCGWVGRMGYNKDSVYAANAYCAEGNEQIQACGFYALGPNTVYEVYFVKNFTSASSLSDRKLMKKGMISRAGYYTIPFDTPQNVSKGENFAIVLYIKTPSHMKPLAIEYAAGEKTKYVDLTDSTGFVSATGNRWERVEEVAKGNVCLKAYSTNVLDVEKDIRTGLN